MQTILEKINKEWCPITWTLDERLSEKEIYVFNAEICGMKVKAQANADEPTRLYGLSFVQSFTDLEMSLLQEKLKKVAQSEKDSYAVETLREVLYNEIEEKTQDNLAENYSEFKKSDETGDYFMEDIEEKATEDVIEDYLRKCDDLGLYYFMEFVLNGNYKGLVSLSKENPYVK